MKINPYEAGFVLATTILSTLSSQPKALATETKEVSTPAPVKPTPPQFPASPTPLPKLTATPLPKPTETPKPKPLPSPVFTERTLLIEEVKDKCLKTKSFREGPASYYTINGCLGCSSDRKTASGEYLDDSKLTAAIPKELPLLKHYLVENLITGESVVVWGNDRGGFDGPPWYRVADLSLKAKNSIGEDLSRVRITLCAE